MSASAYSFLPWLRQGIAIDARPDPAGGLRATVPISLVLTGEGLDGAALAEPIVRDVPLYGAGDVVGIEGRAIVRTEPRNLATNFEPNYVPCIEFYDEDFPWRYSPATPDLARNRLLPWIALAVLADGEFEDKTDIEGKPLPYVVIQNAHNILPSADQLWAWAHVHVNRALPAADPAVVSDDGAANAAALQSVLDENPDLAYSRILCPRRLKENCGYTALLIPVFESGRRAALGLDPAGAPGATFSAWADYPDPAQRPQPASFPYYYRWYFRTGGVGDFEHLVRLLQAKPVDARVGYRDLDVQAPGSNLPGITDARLGGILKLGGALRAPRASLSAGALSIAERYDNWAAPAPHAFQSALARLVNLADDYGAQSAATANASSNLGSYVQGDPDPLITPPIYGRWHGLSERLIRARNGQPLSQPNRWVHDLNLDPPLRVAAGFGTRIIQDNQESYMDAAWAQIGSVLEANRRIRLGQLAMQVSSVWYAGELATLAATQPEHALSLVAPVHSRVVTGGRTVHHRIKASTVPRAAMSAPMRRMLRPRGPLVHALPFDHSITPGTLLGRLNSGAVTAAPPKTAPPCVPTTHGLADELERNAVPQFIIGILRSAPWLRFLILAIALLLLPAALFLGVGAVGLAFIGAVGAGLIGLYVRVAQWRRVLAFGDTLRGTSAVPGSTRALTKSPDFRLSTPGQDYAPSSGATDSVEAVRFKAALEDWYVLRTAAQKAEVPDLRAPLELGALTAQTIAALDPAVTIPRLIRQGIAIPPHIQEQLGDEFREVMAYPEIDIPMYEPLVARSTDMFMPNLNLLQENSITLLESNQRFLEAYMVGLNHEFARELLWREYPTDQRGTCFAQFWDVKGYLDTSGLTPEALRAALHDIPPLHTWPRSSRLGEHDNRQQGGAARDDAVFAIRGELLKKYPTAVIYAQRATWQRTADGRIDNTKERMPVALTAQEEESGAPRTVLRLPLYEAKIAPDIYFFGFDLSVAEAKGASGENAGDAAGWFFVIKERPGEPRFGLDIERAGPLHVWNDLSWEDARPGIAAGQYVEITGNTAPLNLTEPVAAGVVEKRPQWDEDRFVAWNRDTNAADLAYILYQPPVRVMVHASEMLRSQG